MRVLVLTMAIAAGPWLLWHPVSGAVQNPEPEEQGSTWLAGVQVSAAADMWPDWPGHLKDVVALLVTIDNQSKDALQLRYQEFRLVATTGPARMALPPHRIEGPETRGTIASKALPEGILDPGARVQGFLYFEDGEDPPNDTAVFEMDVVRAANGRTIGTTRIRLEID